MTSVFVKNKLNTLKGVIPNFLNNDSIAASGSAVKSASNSTESTPLKGKGYFHTNNNTPTTNGNIHNFNNHLNELLYNTDDPHSHYSRDSHYESHLSSFYNSHNNNNNNSTSSGPGEIESMVPSGFHLPTPSSFYDTPEDTSVHMSAGNLISENSAFTSGRESVNRESTNNNTTGSSVLPSNHASEQDLFYLEKCSRFDFTVEGFERLVKSLEEYRLAIHRMTFAGREVAEQFARFFGPQHPSRKVVTDLRDGHQKIERYFKGTVEQELIRRVEKNAKELLDNVPQVRKVQEQRIQAYASIQKRTKKVKGMSMFEHAKLRDNERKLREATDQFHMLHEDVLSRFACVEKNMGHYLLPSVKALIDIQSQFFEQTTRIFTNIQKSTNAIRIEPTKACLGPTLVGPTTAGATGGPKDACRKSVEEWDIAEYLGKNVQPNENNCGNNNNNTPQHHTTGSVDNDLLTDWKSSKSSKSSKSNIPGDTLLQYEKDSVPTIAMLPENKDKNKEKDDLCALDSSSVLRKRSSKSDAVYHHRDRAKEDPLPSSQPVQTIAVHNDRQPSRNRPHSTKTKEELQVICRLVSLYKFVPESKAELPLEAGDIVEVLATTESGWWKGRCHRRVGYFPRNYVREIDPVEERAYLERKKTLANSILFPTNPDPQKSISEKTSRHFEHFISPYATT